MTINFQQVNNNPFVVGSIAGAYGLGVSIGDIEELYELLGYTESQDIASELLSTTGFSLVGAVPEVIKSVAYRDDVRAAYRIATNVTDNKFEQLNLSNRFEDLLIGETKAYNAAQDGKNWFTRIFSKMRRDGSSNNNNNILKKGAATTKTTTNMATNGVIHQTLNITKQDGTIDIKNITNIKKLKQANAAGTTATGISASLDENMEKITQKLASTARDNDNNFSKLSDLKNINNDTIKTTAADVAADVAAKSTDALGKAASSSISNIKSVSKSMAKEAFGGWGITLTALSGLISEIPNISTAFKESSNEGWAQLGKSAATIAISDVGLSAAGQILGGTLGFALGGLIGPVGASIGGAIGKMVGSSLGSFVGRKLSSWIFGKSATEKQEEEEIKEQVQTVASSQISLQSLLTQAKTQAASETDSSKAKQILAKVQSIENKLNTSTFNTNSQTTTNPFISAV